MPVGVWAHPREERFLCAHTHCRLSTRLDVGLILVTHLSRTRRLLPREISEKPDFSPKVQPLLGPRQARTGPRGDDAHEIENRRDASLREQGKFFRGYHTQDEARPSSVPMPTYTVER
ncbi:hypothetical protein JMJ77_0006031 [Colletotrichum scovillei]|uniref:Uncharacterized protein n=2 Tax=Colletotrichum scovillei TaxID=1209932 RepID=A0A9P7UKW9_9PEZI|nr:hypothetical protein JMJ77_0006031 [Colletotrichum scovillei]KAG7077229.1 hypothetical protein JMJ76_0014479 [Colletotrichum scovillei]KAG7084344.1 hypothetical protein JMJ78_0009781 [Colletotrichum scovillei]